MWPALALSATVVATSLVVVAQPVRSPWWTHADADAAYTGASLNLLLGAPVRYLDHPGLPLEELLAAALGADYLVEKARFGVPSRSEYVNARMLDLDRTRPYFRGLGVAFYFAGSILSVVLLARLLGHWGWGLAGGLLWVAAPGLIPMSIMYRPDVPLAALTVVFAYLVARAVATRSPTVYAAAGVVVGLSVMVKLHAVGLLVPFAVATIWKPPKGGWERQLVTDARRVVNRRPFWVTAGALAWLGLVAVVNYGRFPFTLSQGQKAVLLVPILVVGGLLALSLAVRRLHAAPLVRRALDPFYAFAAASVLVGLAIPITIDARDGVQALVNVANALSGHGVNEGIPVFSGEIDLLGPELRGGFLVLLLAGAGALVGLVVRDPRPLLWFLGAGALAAMAYARQPFAHYFAPAFLLSVPAALWLLRRFPRPFAAIITTLLVAFVLVPPFENRHQSRIESERLARDAAPVAVAVAERLKPGEVALAPSYWPHPDPRYYDMVQFYVEYSPPYPYRFLPPTAIAFAEAEGLRIRYYVGPEAADVERTQTLSVQGVAEFEVRPVPDLEGVVELLSGPGVTPPEAS